MQSSIDARDLALFHAKKAFDLRDRVTQAERFNINIMFYTVVNGDLEKAIGEAGLYSRTYRDNPDPYMALAVFSRKVGRYEGAADAARDAVRLSPGDGVAHLQLAWAYLRLNRYDEAATVLNRLYRPTILAQIELQRGDPARAIETLRPALIYEKAEDFYLDKYTRGQAYLRLKDGEKAANEFRKILDNRGQDPLSPFYSLSYLGMAKAARLSGQIAESKKYFQDFLAIMKDADDDLPVVNEAEAEYSELLRNETVQ